MFAHSVKNRQTIHYRRGYQDGEYNVYRLIHPDSEFAEFRYVCCGSYTPSKATDDRLKITCKNCIKIVKEMDQKCEDCNTRSPEYDCPPCENWDGKVHPKEWWDRKGLEMPEDLK